MTREISCKAERYSSAVFEASLGATGELTVVQKARTESQWQHCGDPNPVSVFLFMLDVLCWRFTATVGSGRRRTG